MMNQSIDQKYLNSSHFINSDHPDVVGFTIQKTEYYTELGDKIEALYYAVRDGFRYNPYSLDLSREAMRASHIVNRDYGYCVEKSCLFAACCRVLGVPARLGFANVRNHIGTARLEEILQSSTLVFHGFAEIFWNNQWIKITPVFNKGLCEILNVAPLDFNLYEDSIFQEFNNSGGKFMEYLHDYGHFADIPYELFMRELAHHYPHLTQEFENGKQINLK